MHVLSGVTHVAELDWYVDVHKYRCFNITILTGCFSLISNFLVKVLVLFHCKSLCYRRLSSVAHLTGGQREAVGHGVGFVLEYRGYLLTALFGHFP